MKNFKRLLPVFIILLLLILWLYREKKMIAVEVSLSGNTMGTDYHITYLVKGGADYQQQIDSLLKVWNMSMSTFIPGSEISYFNTHDTLVYRSKYFYPVLLKSREVYKATGGAFDPTVMPLVNAWGFGPARESMPDSAQVDSILQYIGFDKLDFDATKVWKKKKGIQLDFSAIAKGYGVDVIGNYLLSKGVENYIVEIGGEVRSRGKNKKDKLWTAGIEDPKVDVLESKITAVLKLNNEAVATSGNYRNYYVKNGKKYSHEINPFTGYPAEQNILSASVIAPDCMTADAFATGFMVLGLDGSLKVLEKRKDLKVYFIYSDAKGNVKTYMSNGVKDMIRTVQ